jgi:TfoX/Sxy family transcriptional regulator of competence genes
MPHDPDLADRMEKTLRERGVDPVAKKMFGGVAFLVNGNMSYGTSNDEMHVRVGPDAYEAALARPQARLMDMTGRVMKGWVTVDGPADLSDEALGEWAELTLEFVKTLSAK